MIPGLLGGGPTPTRHFRQEALRQRSAAGHALGLFAPPVAAVPQELSQ